MLELKGFVCLASTTGLAVPTSDGSVLAAVVGDIHLLVTRYIYHKCSFSSMHVFIHNNMYGTIPYLRKFHVSRKVLGSIMETATTDDDSFFTYSAWMYLRKRLFRGFSFVTDAKNDPRSPPPTTLPVYISHNQTDTIYKAPLPYEDYKRFNWKTCGRAW
jgi:hypothetical protein